MPCRAGLRYLLKTGDTLFSGATARDQPKPLGIAEAIVRLGSGSATVRMEVLWEVPRLGPASDDLVAGVARCLDDPDIELRPKPPERSPTLARRRERPCPRCSIV